ncbi:MAG TPA: hypothetical protein VFE05_21470 [Longimicrobiaceae bacterium]|jgi:hypothetical protein|nr:hypothetical protein [Longimicrobiaceae bacterium]
MRKLHLDDLAVESFSTTKAGDAIHGTVAGFDAMSRRSIEFCPVSGTTCEYTCATCPIPCG